MCVCRTARAPVLPRPSVGRSAAPEVGPWRKAHGRCPSLLRRGWQPPYGLASCEPADGDVRLLPPKGICRDRHGAIASRPEPEVALPLREDVEAADLNRSARSNRTRFCAVDCDIIIGGLGAGVPTERQTLCAISPCFIVSDVPAGIRFYVERLGFELRFSEPVEDPFFAIVGRDSVQLFLKAVGPTVLAQPNHTRHEWSPWDAFV